MVVPSVVFIWSERRRREQRAKTSIADIDSADQTRNANFLPMSEMTERYRTRRCNSIPLVDSF